MMKNLKSAKLCSSLARRRCSTLQKEQVPYHPGGLEVQEQFSQGLNHQERYSTVHDVGRSRGYWYKNKEKKRFIMFYEAISNCGVVGSQGLMGRVWERLIFGRIPQMGYVLGVAEEFPRIIQKVLVIMSQKISHAQSMHELCNGPRPSYAQLDGTEFEFEIRRGKRAVVPREQARLIVHEEITFLPGALTWLQGSTSEGFAPDDAGAGAGPE
ncbi:hypothetical protein DEU56DRAFT_758650 [Suillus clintonianus]|uniref:uncharacterized protein n=1 Tax=Suillus clintonianus TaxID=1904413 RepID=UPI001B882DCC|nr:uncharacterized protein DEU56DRAFT_758650 [Suillus clintonianus]KAG2127199.1 hypothetical protein DEU56DRAFT_758650 [Suillus clintonianus]